MFISALYVILPLLCIMAVPQSPEPHRGAFAERIVFGIAIYEILVLSVGLTLGMAHLLKGPAYLAAMLFISTMLAIRSCRNGFTFNPKLFLRVIKTRRGLATVLLAILIAIIYLVELGIDARYGTKHVDGLWYHIPRIIFWRQQGDFAAWPTSVWPQIGLPIGADVVLGQKILLGSGWLGTGYVTFILSLGAIACVYVVALDLGLSTWNAALSALLFSSFPVLGLRIWSLNSDITAAFPVMASYVLLLRVRNFTLSTAMFIVLNGIAVACKQTVIFQVILLFGIVLWQFRRKFAQLRSLLLPTTALLISVLFVFLSFLPVYQTFGDINGGTNGSGNKVTSVAEFNHAVAMSTGHWLLEPIGYVTPVPQLENLVKKISLTTYRILGARFTVLPEKWKPWPAQDISRSGLVAIIFLPVLLYGLPTGVRTCCTLLFLMSFVPLSGILYAEPYFARYTVVVLAGYALIWGGTKYFRRGNKRWLLLGVTALNMASLLGVVLMRFYVDQSVKSKPGGPYYYFSDSDRQTVAKSLNDRPLQIIAADSLDALIVGPDISFKMSYESLPANCDMAQAVKTMGGISNWIAIVHNGNKADPLIFNPNPTNNSWCQQIDAQKLEDTLQGSGWKCFSKNPLADLWEKI